MSNPWTHSFERNSTEEKYEKDYIRVNGSDINNNGIFSDAFDDTILATMFLRRNRGTFTINKSVQTHYTLYVQYSQSNISVKQNTFLCISMRAKSEILLPKVIEHTPS